MELSAIFGGNCDFTLFNVRYSKQIMKVLVQFTLRRYHLKFPHIFLPSCSGVTTVLVWTCKLNLSDKFIGFSKVVISYEILCVLFKLILVKSLLEVSVK